MIDSRKFRVGLIALGVVLVAYLLYSIVGKTPPLEIDIGSEFEDTITDTNMSGFGDEVGKIGEVGIRTVRKAKYVHLNEQKQVDRDLGFEKLLHDEGNEWEIEKPYMNIFQRNLDCLLTADRAKVQVETVGERPSPKDAVFTGNVVAHILPKATSDVQEGFLYLDDVTFLSDKSQFFTLGPVKYVSQDIQMLGNGLELIYNERLERIEYLRIFQLESLHLKTASSVLFPTEPEPVNRPADTNSPIQTQPPEKIVTVNNSKKTESLSDAGTKSEEPNESERYRCVFSKNVVIDTPEQFIFAGEKLSIDNIFRPKDSGDQSDKTDPCDTARINKPAAGSQLPVVKQSKPNSAGDPNTLVKADRTFIDIVVTSDNGLVITPTSSAQTDTNSTQISYEQLIETAADRLRQLNKAVDPTTFIGQKIDFCAETHQTIATGPSELKFYTADFMHPDTNGAVVPVTITAQKKAQFLPATNQALFEGDCTCIAQSQDPNGQQKCILSAPKITVDVKKQKEKQHSAMAGKINHLTAAGPTARLAIVKMSKDELLGGFELKCNAIDYDADRQFFSATGPGVVKVDNSKISEPNEDTGRFSIRRKSYSIVENFDTLKYFIKTNQVIAEAEGQGVVVNYFPIIDGKYDRHIIVTAGRIIGNLIETPSCQTELSTLDAMDGVTYREEDMEFAGSKLFYDVSKAVIKVEGDESQPCIFNGVPVDKIEYDLKTKRAKFRIVGPGTLQRKK